METNVTAWLDNAIEIEDIFFLLFSFTFTFYLMTFSRLVFGFLAISGCMLIVMLGFNLEYPNTEVKNIKSYIMLIYLNIKYMIQKPKTKNQKR